MTGMVVIYIKNVKRTLRREPPKGVLAVKKSPIQSWREKFAKNKQSPVR